MTKTTILFYSTLLLLLVSCHNFGEATIDQNANVHLSFQLDEMTAVKALTTSQENEIADLNLYVYRNNHPELHLYLYTPNEAALTLLEGEYELLVVANAGYDLGNKTREELTALYFEVSSSEEIAKNGNLFMSAQQTITVQKGSNIFNIPLKRIVAKVDLSVVVNPALGNSFSILSIAVMNAPNTIQMFEENNINTSSQVVDYPKTVLNNVKEASFSFYLGDNLQGVNNTISDQIYKNRSNAPTWATYIHIECLNGTDKVDYFLFLGENTTTDFNIRKNSHYRIICNITGSNTIDTRVSTSKTSLGTIQNEYYAGDEMQIPLTISSVNNPDNWFDMTVRFEKSRSGDGSLKVDGITQESSKPFRIMTGAGSKSSTISYSQNSASQTNILITITDRYGFETSYQRSTVFKPNPLMMQVDNYIKIKPHETG